jgi:hypothetical protein
MDFRSRRGYDAGMAKKTQKKRKSKMGADPLAFWKAKQVKTHPKADTAFANVVYRLKERPELKWRGKAVTREAVYAAVSLWLSEMDVEDVARAMAVYLPKLEQIMLGKAQPPTKGDPSPVVEIEITDQVEVQPPKKSRRRPKSAG